MEEKLHDDRNRNVDQALEKVLNTIHDLIAEVYPDISNLTTRSNEWLCERAIISRRNV